MATLVPDERPVVIHQQIRFLTIRTEQAEYWISDRAQLIVFVPANVSALSLDLLQQHVFRLTSVTIAAVSVTPGHPQHRRRRRFRRFVRRWLVRRRLV